MIECVANVSEGRDATTIAAMAEAIRGAGARLLDTHSDADHHRTVYTFVGSPEALERASVALAREAAARIDLSRHAGVHPRVGALDVVPFVPLRDATMDDCVELARRAGEAIARETAVPVFLYGVAATDPARATLAALRRGGPAGLALRMESGGWAPDFGPRRLHPTAGAVAVGARPPLVAFNVRVASHDLSVGRAIARAMRATNGGPRGVQALAFELESSGAVQISMNLTDLEATSVRAAFARVSCLARDAGVAVAGSEIVGLAPRRALAGVDPDELGLPGRAEDYALEARLEAA